MRWKCWLAERCAIQLSYAIGVSQPLSSHAELYGTGNVDPAKLEIALAKGKKIHDKRETEKKRDWQRQKARLLRENN